jgi:hypothetical protein
VGAFPADLGPAVDQRLKPRYHTELPRGEEGFMTIISLIKGCVNAPSPTDGAEMACIEGTIPIRADFWFGLAIVPWASAGSGVLLERER